jgi:chorismate synthase
VEEDAFRIVSGTFRGKTTGTPLCILIPNTQNHSSDYENAPRLARPGHADYTAYQKYHGYEDFRGGGHFSGRLTAPLVAAGAIVQTALSAKGITIATHIAAIGGVSDRPFGDFSSDAALLADRDFPVLDEQRGEKMQRSILAAREDGDSVGGILETVVLGMPAGVGEPFFDSIESRLAHMLFSVPAVKGVEFGDGFALADMRGSDANDPMTVQDGKVITTSNHAGGIYGGITSGAPILFRAAIKPTPSIFKEQCTVSLTTGNSATLALKGRHDPCIVHRAAPVFDAVTALLLADLLAERFGTDYLMP